MNVKEQDKLQQMPTANEVVGDAVKTESKGEKTPEPIDEISSDKKEKRVTKRGENGGRLFPTLTDFFATVGVFVVSLIVASFVMLFLMRGEGVDAPTPQITFITYVLQFLPVVAFIMWLRHKAGRDSGIHLGVRRATLPMLLWGVVLLLASGVVLEPLLELFPTESYEAVKNTIGLGGWAILSTVVAAPLLEETLFRGLIFESCRERLGRGGALLVSAFLFGVVHVVPVQVVNAFVVGLILGYVYLRTRSLFAVIVLHAINNAIAYVTMAFFGEGGEMTLSDMLPTKWLYWTIYGLSATLFLYAMFRLWRSLRDDTELE